MTGGGSKFFLQNSQPRLSHHNCGGSSCSSRFVVLPKDKKKKKDAGKSAKKDKDQVSKSGTRPKRSGPKAKFGTSSII